MHTASAIPKGFCYSPRSMTHRPKRAEADVVGNVAVIQTCGTVTLEPWNSPLFVEYNVRAKGVGVAWIPLCFDYKAMLESMTMKRKEFEQWALSKKLSVAQDHNGRYVVESVQLLWQAWQELHVLAIARIPPLMTLEPVDPPEVDEPVVLASIETGPALRIGDRCLVHLTRHSREGRITGESRDKTQWHVKLDGTSIPRGFDKLKVFSLLEKDVTPPGARTPVQVWQQTNTLPTPTAVPPDIADDTLEVLPSVMKAALREAGWDEQFTHDWQNPHTGDVLDTANAYDVLLRTKAILEGKSSGT